MDVYGNGNCFYRAISVCLHGSQAQLNIRQNVAEHMLIHGKNIFHHVRPVLDDISIKKRADSIGNANVWAGQDAILTTADYLNRDIHVNMACIKSSPEVHSPALCIVNFPPLTVAFFEPGHYKAVLSINEHLNI